jgi:hypothetical protein
MRAPMVTPTARIQMGVSQIVSFDICTYQFDINCDGKKRILFTTEITENTENSSDQI